MSSAIFSLPEFFATYKNWVSSHPQLASDLETTTKWLSYFITGRINNSHILSELVYSLSNLLVLFNDQIIRNATRKAGNKNSEQRLARDEQLKIWLTVVDYSEVFFELSAVKLWGQRGRWLLIACLQMLKCITRLILVFHHKTGIIENPPVPVLKRRADGDVFTNEPSCYGETVDLLSFTLEHSGKIVRRVDTAPPVAFRNWRPPQQSASVYGNDQAVLQNLANKQLIAETLYVLKPMVHLGSVACFGSNTWKPWLISLFMDLYSLWLYRVCKNKNHTSLTKQQQLQISRRAVILLLYLLRSPFYEHHSRERLERFLDCVGKRVPLAGLICNPLLQYLPFWQRTYFYMWST